MGKRKSRMDKLVELMFEAENPQEAYAMAAVARTLAEKRFGRLYVIKAKKGGKADARAETKQAES